MAPEDREANLLIAVAAPVNASAVPPLGAAEAGASATACTGSRHCSPRSTLHSPGPHRVSHAPRPSGFLGFLKYSCTDMPIDLDIHLAFDDCAAPSIPRSRTGSRCDPASFYTPLSQLVITHNLRPWLNRSRVASCPRPNERSAWRPAVLLRAFDPGFPG
jgi:hypothetical protein